MTGDPDSKWAEPYRWACPRGHIFRRELDPETAIECYSCITTYQPEELVDRTEETAERKWE